jgi:hypothetical protein
MGVMENMHIFGYAAFLDIMGFSSIVLSERHREGIDNYLRCLRSSLDANTGVQQIEYVVFSDSIVITTADDCDVSLQALLQGCSTLFGALLANEIPVRGAIAHGSYVREKTPSGSFVAGRAIIEAYQFEGKQDWVGIMLAPSVIRKVPNLADRCRVEDPHVARLMAELIERLPWAAFVQPCNEIPFHGSGNYHGFAVVPTNGALDLAALRDSIYQSVKSLERLEALAPSPETQSKHHRSICWLSDIRGGWHRAAFRREQQATG